MLEPSNSSELPTIPGKRYFTIGEVSELACSKAPCSALLGARVPSTPSQLNGEVTDVITKELM